MQWFKRELLDDTDKKDNRYAGLWNVKEISAGKNAGMKVCAVEDDFSKPQEARKRELADFYINDYDDIKNNTAKILNPIENPVIKFCHFSTFNCMNMIFKTPAAISTRNIIQ